MKWFLALMLFGTLSLTSLQAQPTASPGNPALTVNSEPLDFSITLKHLHDAAASGDDRAIPGGRLFIFNAEIGSVTVFLDDAESFYAEVELIGGAWLSERTLEMYRAYAIFEGLYFQPFFSRRSPERFQPGDSLLVLARYWGMDWDYDESALACFVEAIDVRPLP